MSEAERIILTLSDSELLIYHEQGGQMPPQMMRRLELIIATVTAEQAIEPPPAWQSRNPTAAVLRELYKGRVSAERRRKIKGAARRRLR